MIGILNLKIPLENFQPAKSQPGDCHLIPNIRMNLVMRWYISGRLELLLAWMGLFLVRSRVSSQKTPIPSLAEASPIRASAVDSMVLAPAGPLLF